MTARHLRHSFVVSLVLIAAAVRPVRGEEIRTWTDNTGQYKVEAEFIEIQDGKVRLKTKDGKVLTLPLAKVSEDDRAYLKDAQKRRAAAADPNNPFNGGDDPSFGGGGLGPSADEVNSAFAAAAARAGAFGGRGAGLPQGIGGGGSMKPLEDYKVGDKVEVQDSDWRWTVAVVSGFERTFGHVFVTLPGTDEMIEVRTDHDIRPFDPTRVVNAAPLSDVDLASIPRIIPLGDSLGKFEPDPAPAASTDWTPRPVALSQSTGFFESVLGVSFANSGVKAAIGHAGGAGVRDDSSRIEICDLKAGRISAVLHGPSNMKLFAISPSGGRLLTASDVDHFFTGPVQLWEIGETSLKPLKSWQASQENQMGRSAITWMGWTDEEHAMTVGANGLTMWAVDGPKGVYQITGNQLGAPAFSPGGRQFAIGTEKGFSIHDVATGELLSRIALDSPSFERRVAFSPSGKLLAVAGSSSVEIYDVTTGQKVTEAYAAGSHVAGLAWTDEENVLVGGTSLIHLPSQMTVWTYKHTAESVVPLASRIWYVMGGRMNDQPALLPFKLPHAAVKPVAESELVLKPGDQVSLELEVSFNIQQGASAASPQDQLKDALADAGFIVVDNSNKKLVGRAITGETKEVEYHDRMHPYNGPSQKVSVTQRIFELELLVDGQSVWKRSRVIDAPSGFMIQENETLEQAIERIMAADIGFFRTTVPSRLLPTSAEEARTSTLSINGIE